MVFFYDQLFYLYHSSQAVIFIFIKEPFSLRLHIPPLIVTPDSVSIAKKNAQTGNHGFAFTFKWLVKSEKYIHQRPNDTVSAFLADKVTLARILSVVPIISRRQIFDVPSRLNSILDLCRSLSLALWMYTLTFCVWYSPSHLAYSQL